MDANVASEKPYEVRYVGSWEEFDHVVDDLDEWLFRGQQSSYWHLATSIERYAVGMTPSDAEQAVLRAFKRRAHQYLAPSLLPMEPEFLEWLALLQHHGAPTRLLDWTRSPYVALFFALEDAIEPFDRMTGEPCHCAVWAVNRDWCLKSVADALTETHGNKAESLAIECGIHSDVFEECIRKPALTIVVPVDPLRQNERAVSQQGAFLATGNPEKSFEDNLFATPGATASLVKLIVPLPERVHMLHKLRVKMNISRATLFPGLDGFAQSLRHEIACETMEEANRRVLDTFVAGKGILRTSIGLKRIVKFLQSGTDESARAIEFLQSKMTSEHDQVLDAQAKKET